MNTAILIPLVGAVIGLSTASFAQPSTRIYRCGNTYTNSAAEAQANGCKLMEGGNITVVQGTRVSGNNAGSAGSASSANSGVKLASAPSSSQRVDSEDQKARDADARAILEAELKKAEVRQAELAKEFNNGEPEKLGPEHKNHQKWIDRVAELKASIARNENDIAGLRRELARIPAK